MKNKTKNNIIIILSIGIFFLVSTQFIIGLDIENLNPTLTIEMDENHQPSSIDAYLIQGGTPIELKLNKVSDNKYNFNLKNDPYIVAGRYDFVLKYLDYNNILKEMKTNINIIRPIPNLISENFEIRRIVNEKNVLIDTIKKDLSFSSNVQLGKFEYKICEYSSTNCDVASFVEEILNSNTINIDLKSLGFEMPESGQDEYKLIMKLYDMYNVEFSDLYQYKLVLDDIKPEIDVDYGSNLIYNTVFDLKINASENVVCRYSYKDFESVYSEDYKKEITLNIINLKDDEYDFKVECKDFVGNLAEKEFTISVESGADNKILSILPMKYMNKDFKFTISTNRESTCKYSITDKNNYISIPGERKIHEVSIASYEGIEILSEIVVFVECNFAIATKGRTDSANRKFIFDFIDPEITIKAKNTYKNVVEADISLYDNIEFQECFIEINSKKIDCRTLGIDYKKEKNISKEISFIQSLDVDTKYTLCLEVKDSAGNIVKKCDDFIKDLSLTPDEIVSCSDNIKNQGESDIDCGGPCKKCGLDSYCNRNSDCESNADCVLGSCVINHCYNFIFDKNLSEMGLDCGGDCSYKGLKCAVSSDCEKNSDCTSDFCDINESICKLPTCEDGFKNQDESDIDCGGSSCKKCDVGLICSKDSDCETGVCSPSTKQCSQYTQSELESMREENEEIAIEAGFKEKNPLSILLYIGLGFITLVILSLGYYAYAHKEKNNYDQKNTRNKNNNQNNQNQNNGNNQNANYLNNNMHRTSSSSSNPRSFAQSVIRGRLNSQETLQKENSNLGNKEFVNKQNSSSRFENIGKLNINKSNLKNISEILNNKKSFTKETNNSKDELSNRINLKVKQVESENTTFSKDDFKNLTKEELVNKLKAVKKLKEIQEKENVKITMDDIEKMKNENRNDEIINQLKEIESRRDINKKDIKEKDIQSNSLSKEIESLLSDDSNKELNKNTDKEISEDINKNIENKKELDDKLKNTNSNKNNNEENNKENIDEKDVFRDLENEIKSEEDLYDKVDKI